MRITTSFDYAATPEDVFAMLADPAFQAAKVEATHPLSHTASVTPKGEQTEIVTSRVISTDGFPDFAKSMIGPKLKWFAWRMRRDVSRHDAHAMASSPASRTTFWKTSQLNLARTGRS